MALFKSTQVTNKVPVPSGNGGTSVIVVVGDFAIPAGFAANDVVEMGGLPDGYVIVDLNVDNASLGSTVTADWGLLSGDFDSTGTRTCGAQLISAAAMGTAGIKRASVAGSMRIAPTTTGKGRGWGFTATAVTSPTTAAVVRATLFIRPQSEGV